VHALDALLILIFRALDLFVDDLGRIPRGSRIVKNQRTFNFIGDPVFDPERIYDDAVIVIKLNKVEAAESRGILILLAAGKP